MKKMYMRSFRNVNLFVRNINKETLNIMPVDGMIKYIGNDIYCRYIESGNCMVIAKVHFNNNISDKVKERIDEGDFSVTDVINMMKKNSDSFAILYRINCKYNLNDTEKLVKFLMELGDLSRSELARRDNIKRTRKEMRELNLSHNSKEVRHFMEVRTLYYKWKHAYVEIPNVWEGMYGGKFDRFFEKVRNPINPNATYYSSSFSGDDWNRDGCERGIWDD